MRQNIEITQETIERFINGDHPQEGIVNITYDYADDHMVLYIRGKDDIKYTEKDSFKPFVWAKAAACRRLCDGDKSKLRELCDKYSIGFRKLSNVSIEGEVREEFNEGYMFMIYAKKPMSYRRFQEFFSKCGNPLRPKKNEDVPEDRKDQYLTVNPIDQYLIYTGKRFFKGFNDYDNLLRIIFDLETTGLDKEKDRIIQLGVRLNRPIPSRPEGFQKIFTVTGNTEEERNKSEKRVICTLFKIIATFQPDVVTAHNGENFDWGFIIGACKRLGGSIEKWSAPYFNGQPIKKSQWQTILKLGGEIEKFYPTQVPYTIVTDSLHAVRRAQAIDSNMQKADLKYVTDYSGLRKENRVYTPGQEISKIWADKEHQYAFNDTDGDWYIYDKEHGDPVKHREDFGTEEEYESYIKSIKGKDGDKPFKLKTRNELLDGYEITTGQYIIERYLLDDLYECDRVEWKYNTTNFLITKIMPLTYKKCTTMGTAGQWKALMLAWSYKYGLAIPKYVDTGSFTGGLSRLLKTGFIRRIIKLDWNSLYPSEILTWGLRDFSDLLNSFLAFLEYVLTTREKFKKEKKTYDKLIDGLKGKIKDGTATHNEITDYQKYQAGFSLADGKQSQMKVLGNSFFGSYGSNKGAVFPWKSAKCAEQTTCIGRQSLRLIISYFNRLGYEPIVGDSVTGDTPLFIRYKDSGLIDIKPISELMDEERTEKDIFGREYDTSEKSYMVLCRSGWSNVHYVYRHKASKDIYRVEDGDMSVDVTQDHSLFDSDKHEIKPTEITPNTKLEYYNGPEIESVRSEQTFGFVVKSAYQLANGKIDRVPIGILNAKPIMKSWFLKEFKRCSGDINKLSKTGKAGILYLNK